MSKPNSETAPEEKPAPRRPRISAAKPALNKGVKLAKRPAARSSTKATAATTPRPSAKRPSRSKPRPRTTSVRTDSVSARPVELPLLSPPPSISISISDAQSAVVASKFRTEIPVPKPRPLPTLPSSYGESHLLLLARDPRTLFVAWDMAPAAVNAVKSRLGNRGFAVSNLTLRLSGAGATSVFHLGKRARSRYLKVDGGPVYVAEIGLTTPSGRFELMARSAPCVVPMGPVAGREPAEGKRAALGYREAQALARRGISPVRPTTGAAGRGLSASTSTASSAAPAGAEYAARIKSAPRVLGGASDLYRR